MCTTINVQTPVSGGGKGVGGWFPVTQASIGYDHTTYLSQQHALLLDFINPALGPSARVAIELNVASGKALLAQLQAVIDAAEKSGFPE
jgi:hypothetical protein